jgi:hypothetical protein
MTQTIVSHRPDTPEDRARREAKVRALLRDDDEMLGRAYDARLVRRLWQFAGPYRRQFVLAVAAMTVATLMSVAGPWVIGRAVDAGLNSTDIGRAPLLDGALCRRCAGRMVLQPPAHLFDGLRRHAHRQRHARGALSPSARTFAQLSQQHERRPPDEPADRRRRRAARVLHLVDHRAGAFALQPDRHHRRHAAAQLAACAGHLPGGAADGAADALLAAPHSRRLPLDAPAGGADQRLSERVDPGHSRHAEFQPGGAQLRPLRRPESLVLRRQCDGDAAGRHLLPRRGFHGVAGHGVGGGRRRLAGAGRRADRGHAGRLRALRRTLLRPDPRAGAALHHLPGDDGRQRAHLCPPRYAARPARRARCCRTGADRGAGDLRQCQLPLQRG